MSALRLTGCDAADPLGYLAAIGTMRSASRVMPDIQLRWVRDGSLVPEFLTVESEELVDLLMADLDQWRESHPAVDFAVGADNKAQDLKHPPAAFRALMRDLAMDRDAAPFIAAYATGVAVDGRGQTKPTSLHFTAGQQRFMVAVLSLRDSVTRDDIREALFGPWVGREGPKDLRWRAASERLRALLSFDPSKEKTLTVAGATWLAFQALPLFPVVPIGARAVTTCVTGSGKREVFTWPVWSDGLVCDEVRTLLAIPDVSQLSAAERRGRGISAVYRSKITRSDMGYGNFAAAEPV